MRGLLLPFLLALALGCSQVEYIQLEPSSVLLKQKNNKVWLSAKCMSHTGVHYANEKVAWSSKDPSIAVVDDKGQVTPVKSGMTEVTARHLKVEASVPVEVRFAEKLVVEPKAVTLKVGEPSVELKARVFDYQGRELKDRTATFKSLDKEVVSMGQNAAFPMNPGKAQVEVRVEELLERIEVTVEPEKTAAAPKKK